MYVYIYICIVLYACHLLIIEGLLVSVLNAGDTFLTAEIQSMSILCSLLTIVYCCFLILCHVPHTPGCVCVGVVYFIMCVLFSPCS